MNSLKYDAVIIGSGIGGYPAASYLASRGLKVAVIEEHLVGGECTNYGCVPSKALYHIAESVKAIEKIGGRAEYNWTNMLEWAKGIVSEAKRGIEYLLKSKGVDIYYGKGVVKNPREVKVVLEGEVIELKANKVLLAVGTDPADLPNMRFDKQGIISNREALYLSEKPERIIIIGGGVVGVELANIYSALGIDATIIEVMEHILPFTDKDIALAVKMHLSNRGVKVLEKTTAIRAEKLSNGKYCVELSTGERLEVDKVVVAVGRKPKTNDIGLEAIGVGVDEKGFIKVDERLETNIAGIHAAGDVVGGPLLAHKALLESISAAMYIAGEEGFKVNYRLIPLTIFSGLEVSSVGLTERELQRMNIKYVRVKVPLSFLSAVKIKGHRNAFAKVLLNEAFNEVYGIHIVAPSASEVISAYMPLYLGKVAFKEASHTPYPHLTVSESLRDLAEYIVGEPVHFLKK
ncbi:MAG: dihydrolipoyl dehydrogenase [Desulfurococcaceae archaeon]|nr:dihydrolipoyl dehydrogenase [Desulfurococcaceae archaeon]